MPHNWNNPFVETVVSSPKSLGSPKNKDEFNSSTPKIDVPENHYEEHFMLGAGQNLNLNVSAIKPKFQTHIVNIGEGLGQFGDEKESEHLFTA